MTTFASVFIVLLVFLTAMGCGVVFLFWLAWRWFWKWLREELDAGLSRIDRVPGRKP